MRIIQLRFRFIFPDVLSCDDGFSLQTCLINHHSIVGDLMGEEVIYEGNSPSTTQTCFQTYVHARKQQKSQLLNDTSWWKSTQTALP